MKINYRANFIAAKDPGIIITTWSQVANHSPRRVVCNVPAGPHPCVGWTRVSSQHAATRPDAGVGGGAGRVAEIHADGNGWTVLQMLKSGRCCAFDLTTRRRQARL